MQAAWRIGSFFGVPLFLDYSWLGILVLFTLFNGLNERGWEPSLSWLVGLAMALLLSASVLLHELAHSLVALSHGMKVHSIRLSLFGGMTALEQDSKTPGQAFQVAIAGPAVNGVLFLLLGLLAEAQPVGSLLRLILGQMASLNLLFTTINLIPGLPLDGGMVLKAAIWKLTGSRFVATRWAGRAGQLVGGVAVAWALAPLLFQGKLLSAGLWTGMVGWFIFQSASACIRTSQIQEVLVNLKAGDAMTREFRLVDANLTLRQFAEEYLLETSPFAVYVASSEGRDRGLVSIDDVRFIERSQWERQTLHHILQPLSQIVTVPASANLVEVINRMESHQLWRLIVLSPVGGVAGVIDRGDLVRVVAKSLKDQISDAEIKRVKQEGFYPPRLPLNAIARTTQEG